MEQRQWCARAGREKEGGREGGGVCSAVREVWILITRTSMVLWRQAEMDGV